MRFLTFDLARGIAYILMIIAHVAPTNGPGRILITSEFLTAPLFSLLVGAGTALSWSHQEKLSRHVATHIIRGAMVFALGWLLGQSSAQVVIVLMHLGVLMGVSSLVTLLPSLAVGAIMIACAGVSAWSSSVQSIPHWLSGPYWPFAFLTYACAGILMVRVFLVKRNPSRWRLLATSALLLGLMLACIVLPNAMGHGVHAYDGSLLETMGNLFGALGIVIGSWFFAEIIGDADWQWLLAAPGQAALSLYTLQIIVLHLWSTTQGSPDDGWPMMFGLTVGGCLFAILWQAPWRRCKPVSPLAGFRRGPLEGLLGLAISVGQSPRRDRTPGPASPTFRRR